MPTTISGAVLLPDGSNPRHGRVIFTARKPRTVPPVLVTGPVETIINAGQISVVLQGQVGGLSYAVSVEYYSEVVGRIVSVVLPDVVILNADASGLLPDFMAITIPPGATTVHVIDQGETLSTALQYLDDNKRPVALHGIGITSWLGRDGSARIPLAVSIVSASSGTFEISLDAAQTVLIAGKYQWAVRMSSGARVQITTGYLIVNEVH